MPAKHKYVRSVETCTHLKKASSIVFWIPPTECQSCYEKMQRLGSGCAHGHTDSLHQYKQANGKGCIHHHQHNPKPQVHVQRQLLTHHQWKDLLYQREQDGRAPHAIEHAHSHHVSRHPCTPYTARASDTPRGEGTSMQRRARGS